MLANSVANLKMTSSSFDLQEICVDLYRPPIQKTLVHLPGAPIFVACKHQSFLSDQTCFDRRHVANALLDSVACCNRSNVRIYAQVRFTVS